MIKEEFIEGFAIDKMVARHLNIEVEWIVDINIDLEGIHVKYNDPEEDEEEE